jgi:hypothetical protein
MYIQLIDFYLKINPTHTENKQGKIEMVLPPDSTPYYHKMTECTQTKLSNFGKKHFTFINQFFGDVQIRKIITEIFPNKNYRLEVEAADETFEYSKHHYLYQIKYDKNGNELVGKGKKVCSVAGKYQNIYINKNDTLCQSYTLLRYLGYNFNLKMTRKEIQSRMCQMYKKIIENEQFIHIIKKEVLPLSENKNRWIDYTKDNEPFITMKLLRGSNNNYEYLFRNINDVLSKWESYGYSYFIGEGTTM